MVTREEAIAELRRRGVIRGVTPIEAFGSGLADSVSLGFGDELQGVGAGLNAALAGQDFRGAYDAQTQRARDVLNRSQQEQPLAAGAGTVAGALVPGFGAAGAVGRAGRLGTRLMRGAGVGAAYGGASGVGGGTDAESRLSGGIQGAGLGAALGAGAQGVVEGVGALARGARNVIPSRRTVPSGPSVAVMDDLRRMGSNNPELGVRNFNDLGRVMSQAAQRDPTLTVAEALGRPGVNRVAGISRLPGQTAQRAERALEENANTFDELTQRLDENLTPRSEEGAPLTRRGAQGELDAEFSRTSMQGYQEAFKNRVSRQTAQRMGNIISQPGAEQLFNRAVREAQDLAALDGQQLGGLTSDPRLWHYIKVAAGDVLRTMRREGLGSTKARQFTRLVRQLTDELDSIPGYKPSRERWGSLSEAQEALEAGTTFDRMAPDEIEDLVSRLTPFQQRYLQAGITERIRAILSNKDNDGLINIAREMTKRKYERLLQVAFRGQRAALQDFLTYARTRRQSFEDRSRMASSRNSVTGIVGSEAVNMPPTTVPGLVTAAARLVYGKTAGAMREGYRDRLGEVLLTPVGRFDDAGRNLMSRASREAAAEQARLRRGRRRTLARTGQSLGAGLAITAAPEQ